MAWTRAALVLVALAAVAAALLSGGSSSDPRTPEALSGLPAPFLSTAALGDGGLTAGLDSYGDVVDLRAPGPAGAALIDNPIARQKAGTVPANTGIVPRVSVERGPPQPLWQADSVRQSYLPETNVLRSVARFGGDRVEIDCAALGEELGCDAKAEGPARVVFDVNLLGGRERVHLDDRAARRIVAAAIAADRRWVARARPLGGDAPDWAQGLYERSLLALRALADRHSGAVAASARDGWAYVWPRDAGATAIALAAAGYGPQARRVARFLLGLGLNAAARFDGDGAPVPGRAAQGDAWGWAAAAAQAAGLPRAAGLGSPARQDQDSWRNRADYQEKSPGDYLANAIANADGPKSAAGLRFSARRPGLGLVRRIGDPSSGLDSAAAWAVRPFPQPALFPAVRITLDRLIAGASRFGIVPSEDWPDAAPWTAPTAWSAWSLAALGERRRALRLLGDLRRVSTPAGLLPERAGARSGVPLSTTPLAWSHAFAILAIRQLWPGRRQRESHRSRRAMSGARHMLGRWR